MIILLPSLACNFSFAASLRTRMPRQNQFTMDKCHVRHTYIAWPQIQQPPLHQFGKAIFQRRSVQKHEHGVWKMTDDIRLPGQSRRSVLPRQNALFRASMGRWSVASIALLAR